MMYICAAKIESIQRKRIFMEPEKPYKSIFRKVVKWQDLRFYQKTDVLYQMTVVFCHRFLPQYGDRTVDQMVQAARSGKQNIVEGCEDGKTSTEMELKLLNVARASIGELREDYQDYLTAHHLTMWSPADERFQPMQDFTKQHNRLEEYEPHFSHWSDEEMANVGLSLCYQVDTMMNKYLANLEKRFVTEGGIKERMYRSRTGYRQQQDQLLHDAQEQAKTLTQQVQSLTQHVQSLTQQLHEAEQRAMQWQAAYDDLKQRALKAYNDKVKEIERLRQEIEGAR